MIPKLKTLSFALAQTIGAGIALTVVVLPVAAQQQSAQTKERIEVTGSNIKRIEGETALPVTVISRDELQNTGVQTAQELLERISTNMSFGNFTEAKGEGSSLVGFTGASLRGFGYQRTLVLLNGKRIAPYALSGGQGVDLSSIPIAALDRIEILKDGASAVYGTDAIAGVINFILRKDFKGVEASAYIQDTDKGGAKQTRYNGTIGFGDLNTQRFNVFFTADYLKQDPLKSAAREISHTAYIPGLGSDRTSGNSLPANISQPGGFSGTRNPTIPFPGGATATSCLRPFSFPTAVSPFQCRFDFASVIETIPESEKTNYIAKATVQLSPNHQAYLEGSYYKGKFIQRISPTPVSSAFTTTLMQISPSSAFYPRAYIASLPNGNVNLPILVSYRALELGPRQDEANVDQTRVVAGVQGAFGKWDYAVAANYTANKQIDSYTGGYISEARFGPLLRSGVVNPFGFNTDAVLNQMRATQIVGDASVNKASNRGVDGKVSTELAQLPGGPLALAIGAEWRKEALSQINADFLSTGDIIGGIGAVPSLDEVNRRVTAFFAEVNVPITRTMELNIAARHDKYSDFGSTTNPKVTMRWSPLQQWLFRAAYGTGFRAPTLSDLFQPPLITNTNGNFDDPLRCPTTGSVFDCNLQFNSQRGGNAALKPEKSKQYYAGFVFEPTTTTSIGIDWYRIEVKNLIVQLDASTIFNNFAFWAPTNVVRRAPDANFPNLPGQVQFVIENLVNIGKQATTGIDVDFTHRTPNASWGRLTARLNGSYVMWWKQSTFESDAYPNFVGTRGPDGAIPRWRHYASLDWTRGPFGLTFAQNFQLGYNEDDFVTGGTRRVGDYTLYDLQGRWTGFRNVELRLGVRNLFDRAPPVSNQNNNFQVGYDPSYGDPRGRIFYGGVRVSFK